jgi:hypothetical protein
LVALQHTVSCAEAKRCTERKRKKSWPRRVSRGTYISDGPPRYAQKPDFCPTRPTPADSSAFSALLQLGLANKLYTLWRGSYDNGELQWRAQVDALAVILLFFSRFLLFHGVNPVWRAPSLFARPARGGVGEVARCPVLPRFGERRGRVIAARGMPRTA